MNKVFKALSDPTRRRVLQLLRERPMSAGELADHFVVSKPTMSAHFAVLQEAGLVEAEKTGRTIVYRLVMSVRWVFSSSWRGFWFWEPPPCRLGRMNSRPRESRWSMFTMAGTRVSRKKALPCSWLSPSSSLRL